MKLEFDNGITIRWEHGLDGGGSTQYKDFLAALKKMSKTYSSGLEWCSGLGAIGYGILDSKICNNFSFMDTYSKAEVWTHVNAITNNIENSVRFIHEDAVAKIPKNFKFDLVVGNPPHSMISDGSMTHDPHFNRLILDDQWKIHIEFFTNIKHYLFSGADVLLSETNLHHEHVKSAESHGLKYIGIYDAPELAKNTNTPAVIMHYRYEI